MNGLTTDITAVAVVAHGVLCLTFADGLVVHERARTGRWPDQGLAA